MTPREVIVRTIGAYGPAGLAMEIIANLLEAGFMIVPGLPTAQIVDAFEEHKLSGATEAYCAMLAAYEAEALGKVR